MIRAVLVDIGDTLVEQIVDDVLPMSRLGLTAFPDAEPALAALKQDGHRIAIVSNTSQSGEDEVRRALDALGLAQYVDHIVTSVDVGKEKPDPAMYTTALDALGCRPQEAVMVGDDLLKDVAGAASAGLMTILVRRDGRRPDPAEAAPTYVVASLMEVPELLRAGAAPPR